MHQTNWTVFISNFRLGEGIFSQKKDWVFHNNTKQLAVQKVFQEWQECQMTMQEAKEKRLDALEEIDIEEFMDFFKSVGELMI